MKKTYVLLVFILVVVVVSGCLDVKNTADEVNQTISQTREDLDFLSWMSSSMQVIKTDYSNVSDSLAAKDGEQLAEAAGNLKKDSNDAIVELGTYSLSPPLQNVSDRYSSFLNESYELGDMLEKNASHIELLDMNSTLREVDEDLMMWGKVYSSLLSQ